jgi:hypothetical protein
VVICTPDSAGRTISAVASVNNINYATAATFQADGQMTAFTSGQSATFAGIANSFTYNNRLQPINMSAVSPSQTVFSIGYDFHWQNSDNGNVFAITNYRDANRNQTFAYDSLNRLTSAQNAGTDCARTVIGGNLAYWGNTYTYDAWGNLTNKTKISTACAGEGLSLTMLAKNRVANAGYGYDAAGNMTLDGTDAVSATYDAENRIATASKGGLTTFTFITRTATAWRNRTVPRSPQRNRSNEEHDSGQIDRTLACRRRYRWRCSQCCGLAENLNHCACNGQFCFVVWLQCLGRS